MAASNNNLDGFYNHWHPYMNCLFDIIKLVALLWLAFIPADCLGQAPHAPTGFAATASRSSSSGLHPQERLLPLDTISSAPPTSRGHRQPSPAPQPSTKPIRLA